jgi:uncharacterized surface protein with fasciclin (FAS1) repeats
MKNAAVAGFAAGVAMMVGGALGAISRFDPPSGAPPGALDESSPEETMNPMIGGQAMLPGRGIMDNIAASPMHGRLAAALKKSGVAAALGANAQFTLFAPTDAALSAEADPETSLKTSLARRMSYLIVPGKYDSQALLRMIGEAGGEVRLHTAEGGVLLARMNGPTNIALMDEKGDVADIAIYDIRARNGIVHVIDHALEPSGSPRQIAAK